MKKIILLIAITLLISSVQTLSLIAPPTTIIECEMNDEVLYPNACLNEDCSIKAFDESPLLEGDCWNVDCTKIVTKEEAEKARLNHPYRIGYQSENYYISGSAYNGKIILKPETEFPPFEVINNICKNDLTEIKEWLTGKTTSFYIKISPSDSELQKELDYYESEMKKREDFKDKQIYSIEQKENWIKINNLATFEIYKNPSSQTYYSSSKFSFLVIGITVTVLLLIMILIYVYVKRRK